MDSFPLSLSPENELYIFRYRLLGVSWLGEIFREEHLLILVCCLCIRGRKQISVEVPVSRDILLLHLLSSQF